MATQGTVAALAANDKYPGTYLESRDETGAGVQTQDLWICAAKDAGGTGDLTVDSEVRAITSDGEALAAWGPRSRGYLMALEALKIPGISIKGSAYNITGTPVQATATLTIDGTWSTAGTLFYRLGAKPIGPINISASDSIEDVANQIADFVNADDTFAAEAAATAGGVADEWVVEFTAGSDGTSGNSLTLWQDTSQAPSGLTSTLGANTAATVVSSVGPWALANGDTLVVAFNAGGDQTFTISAAAATKTGSGASYASVTAGHTLTVTLSGVQYVITFTGSEGNQAQFHATINAVISASGNVSNNGGQTKFTTTKKGSGATGTIDAGDSDVLTSLGLTVSAFTSGTGNVANVAAVTAAEWVTIMSAITNGTAEDDGGALRFRSATLGTSGTVQVKSSSTADDEMTFSNTQQTGATGGASLASGGVAFTGGSGTISVANILSATFTDEFATWTTDVTDATNLGRFETQMDNKLGPLEGRLECAVIGFSGTLSASGSLAQSTLNHGGFEAMWMQESEMPPWLFAARWAAIRHQLEFSTAEDAPNQRYSEVYLPWAQAQEASSIRPSRSTIVSAMNQGLTPLATIKGRVYLIRAVTTRTLTDTGATDDGTTDVAVDRVAKEYRRALKATLDAHRALHKFLDNDPVEGRELDVPSGTTYPKLIQATVRDLNRRKEQAGWLAQTDATANQPQVALNPNSATPRAVVYAPFVPRPHYYQTEGVVAKRKFVVSAST